MHDHKYDLNFADNIIKWMNAKKDFDVASWNPKFVSNILAFILKVILLFLKKHFILRIIKFIRTLEMLLFIMLNMNNLLLRKNTLL